MSLTTSFSPLSQVTHRNLIFVNGKGGVGKTVVSQAIAQCLAAQGHSTLWTTFEDPLRPAGELRKMGENLHYLNCEAGFAFEEYIGLKIRVPGLAKLFVQNKLMRYLSKAAPGIHELVLIGKIWHDRLKYDHVVVDMPSTGYGLTMFQSTENFAKLFKGGPIHRDALAMLETFGNPGETAQVIVSLAEEMPLRESLELGDFLQKIFPNNPAAYVANRTFPHLSTESPAAQKLLETNEHCLPENWKKPLAEDVQDYARKRSLLEQFNLNTWRDAQIDFAELSYVPPQEVGEFGKTEAENTVGTLGRKLREGGYI